jgi:DNA modification methylase
MTDSDLRLDAIYAGDVLDILPTLPDGCIDAIFADPPYNLQLQRELWRPNQTRVDAVDEEWDRFADFAAYDAFTRAWLTQARRVLAADATIWVSGTYHNIFRVGAIMQDLGFWILNSIIWHKPNAMPNFRGTRLKNDVEIVIWAKTTADSRYLFHHHPMKQFNHGKQLGSMWSIPLCTGTERLRDSDGRKLHPTQKPEALLERILLASTAPGDIVLDPFFGTGTTGAVAKRLRRRWIGIERDPIYVQAAHHRIVHTHPLPIDDPRVQTARPKQSRIAFKTLIAAGMVRVGERLTLDDPSLSARVQADGRLRADDGQIGSIHRLACALKGVPSVNGWRHWLYRTPNDELRPIDDLRAAYRIAHVPQNEG